MSNPLNEVYKLGQSIWLDNISRGLIESGELRRLIVEDAVKGMTSNPTIFEKAISSGSDYDASIQNILQKNPQVSVADLYEKLIIKDIQEGADNLRDVYEETNGVDGYISVEVSPELAADTQGTIEEAKSLWQKIDKPNLMIKVPATKEGIPAVRHLISEGINVNVTLMFSMEHYQAVAEAYIAGLEDRVAKGGAVDNIASVASFFVSRVDSAVDKLLAGKKESGLQGKIAVANSKVVYADGSRIFSLPRFRKLADNGAKPQRLLWASTGTKNPAYSDVLYLDELIGADTVNTVPPATLNAFRDHGTPAVTLTNNVDAAQGSLNQLAELGISLTEVAEKLQVDGVQSFIDSFRSLMAVIAKKRDLLLNR